MARALRFEWVLLLASLACDREQHTMLFPPDAGSGGHGGAPAVLDDGGVTDASIAEGTRDGGADDTGDTGDAGDASAEGPLPWLDGQCVEGTLADFCAGNTRCPSRQGALARVISNGATVVVQRPCQSEAGRALVSIGSSFLTNSGAFIYDAQTGELVSVYLIEDVSEYCDERSADAFYGVPIPECSFERPESIPSSCYDFERWRVTDGGLVEQPTPDECVFVEE